MSMSGQVGSKSSRSSERSPGERSDTRVSNGIEVLHATNTLGDADQLRDAATPPVASTSVRPALLSRPTGSFAEWQPRAEPGKPSSG